MAEVSSVLQRCDPSLLSYGDSEQSYNAETAEMFLYLTDRRRVQKVLLRQLFVMDSMMSLQSDQLLPGPKPDCGARGRWKALKTVYRQEAEETETLLTSLHDKVQQINNRRHKLTNLIQQLTSKKHLSEHLEASLQKAHNALQLCDGQLTKLRAESESALSHRIGWQRLRDEVLELVVAVQDAMHVKLLSFNQSELSVELRTRPSSDHNESSNELEPLKLSVTWRHDDHFRLQVLDGAGVVEDSVSTRRCELIASLLNVMQVYVGQADLLYEIQSLRSSFAIDWRPAQRLLVYLKTASLVCHLEVEDGYPGNGQARLLSVRRNGQTVDTSGLKPQKTDLRLTDWLLFLHSSPLI
ncbi:uncharacterized protein si:dkey-225f5.4 isoform X1 [Scomber scombrus]|uniref:uncharacterized protein si:dkey-225f5.4 isoform X1 n=1 Tax=Scomber scombrus TaxID=13677 RepID=UPI002DD82B11|nr:uncharacterized protein si:dkey-225f5.4 isoform X1 [Scomber scombrus]